MGEDDFDLCIMSHILFGLDTIFLQISVLVTFTTVEDCVVDERLMRLRANVTFCGCHPVLFSTLLLAAFERELEGRQPGLHLSALAGNRVVAPFATLIALSCGV